MAGSSVIGTVGSTTTFSVDDRGRVTSPTGSSLDWLVGAADRWHAPTGGVPGAVTHQREGGLPVVETGLRVPGGQLVHRVWCVAADGGDIAVVEVENRSRDAVAVAVLVEATAARFDGGRQVDVGDTTVVAARPVARAAAGTGIEVRSVVAAGGAPIPDGPLAGPVIGLVFPLAHTARLRIALPAPGVSIDPDRIDSLPGADSVATGWRSHLDAGVRLSVPDPTLADAVVAARSTLLLGAVRSRPMSTADAAVVALALDQWGHAEAAAAVLGGVELPGGWRADPGVVAAVLAAWAAHGRGGEGDAVAEGRVEPVARAAHRVGRRHRHGNQPPWFAAAQFDAAELLDRAGQGDAADLCRHRAAAVHPALAGDVDEFPAATVAEVASGDRGRAARFLVDVRRSLADDTDPAAVHLLTGYPDGWLGQDLEVHRLPTRAGLLSFAVRWHGARPALLWERTPSPGAGGEQSEHTPVVVTVPGLDPSWSSVEVTGEALLAPVEPAGGLPKVVAPLPGDGTPVDEVPTDGVSFS